MVDTENENIGQIDYFWVDAIFDHESKIILTSQQVEFLLTFEAFRYSNITWLELWIRIGNFGRDYLSSFFGNCGDQIPSFEDKLDVLEDIYVLQDPSFPYIQLAADASEEIKNFIPPNVVSSHEKTEFGVDILCFSQNNYQSILKIMEAQNKTLVPFSLNDICFDLP